MKMIVMHSTLRPLAALLSVSAVLLAAACGGAGDGQPGAAQSGRPQVVVAFYPFQFIAARVAGGHADVSNLTEPGAEPHDVELTPKQVGSIGEAGLVVYEKSFQPAVDEAVEQSGNANVLDTASVVPLQDLGTEEHAHEDGAEHDEHEAEHEEGGHEHALDPHVWLDPTNLATISTAVAEKLAALDPAHAADYTRNAETLRSDLSTLDQEFTSGLASCQRREFITQHEAFGYLARRYQLEQIPIGGLSPDAEPSPARIAEVQQEARKHGVTTIFYETLVSPAVAEAIAGDLKLKTDVLDPIEGITPESKGQDYLQVMRANLSALQAANQCR
jgi:zinc transport system substrate-binding protein